MLQFDLTNKVAIITGGGTGIGRTIALEFARAGADVVIASRKVPNLEKVVAEVTALGRRALAVATDVRVPEQVDNMVKQTVDHFGKLDILVNNAGAGFVSPAEDISPNGWDAVIGINLKGPFLYSRAAAKVMIPQKRGKIVNIASTAGVSGSPRMAHYGAAKAGVINLTRTLAIEWAQYNINVNAIAPGMIETEGVKAQQILTAEALQQREKSPRLEQPGETEDVAAVALFLASELSKHMTGETIIVRGVPR